MEFKHEIIQYQHETIPINWIVHGLTHTSETVLPHWHASLEVSYTCKGAIEEYKISNTSYCTKAETVLIINPLEIHGAKTTGGSEVEALTIQIPYPFLEKIIPEFKSMRFISNPEGDTNKCAELVVLQQCLAAFYQEAIQTDSALRNIHLASLAYELIYLLVKDWSYFVDDLTLPIVDKKSLTYVGNALAYIQENYDQDLSLGQIAEHVYISSFYLSKLFQKHLGMSVLSYIQLLRVQKAQHLLTYTNKTISTVSDMVGFKNEKSFRNAFVKATGKTPKQYQIIMNK